MFMILIIDAFSNMMPKAQEIVNKAEELVKVIALWKDLKSKDLKKYVTQTAYNKTLPVSLVLQPNRLV